MALKLVLNSLDGLKPEVASEYKKNEADGLFYLETVPFNDGKRNIAVEDIASIKGALASERARADEAARTAKAFEGLDPVAAREAIKTVSDLGNNPKVKEQIDVVTAQLEAKFKGELAKATDKADLYRAQLVKSATVGAATAALTKKQAKVTLALPHVLTHLRPVEIDGTIQVEVVDSLGKARISPAANNNGRMTVEELIDELAGNEEYAPLFPGSGATGGGAGGGSRGAQGGSGGSGRPAVRKITPQEASTGQYADEIAKGTVVVEA